MVVALSSPTTLAARPRPTSRSRALSDRVEQLFDRAFGQAGNPWRHLGGLAFMLFWVAAATGGYVYIGFDTRVDGAYASVERLSANALPLGRFARSLHRYGSDAFVLVTLLHLAREWVRGHYAHFRRFSWLTGVAAAWLVFASGIGGFWLVWDRLAQYSLTATAEWFDALPMFGGALMRNFIASGALGDRLFSLLIFLHIGFPLALLATMWVHLQRLSRPASHPPRSVALGTLAALTLLCLARPVASGAPAAIDSAPGPLQMDWFYLGIHALADSTSPGALWLAVGSATLLLIALPFVRRAPRPAAAVVDLANCNGCARCFADCPYAAVTMQPRSDGGPSVRQAVVDADLCAACGICAGACPSSTPFRSVADLVTGIDVPDAPMQALRTELDAALRHLADVPSTNDLRPRIVVFGCTPAHGGPAIADLADCRTATISLVCAAQLPPSFVEFALRAGADGVLVTGCCDGDCEFRLGNRWTDERLAAMRPPRLRTRVPRERIRVAWTGRSGRSAQDDALRSFRAALASEPARRSIASPPPKRADAMATGRASR
jgi:quinol-cytochrome oxidoreductase complex cytochrome b subunit/coenzyme F420-reducing hydrogenase delta subunit